MLNQARAFENLAMLLNLDHLLQEGIAKTAQIAAEQAGIPFVSYLVQANIVTSEKIFACCKKYLRLSTFDLTHYDSAWLNQSALNFELICQYHVIPLKQDKYFLQLGMSDPTNQAALSAIAFHTGLFLRPILVDENQLAEFIQTHCQPNILTTQLETTLTKIHATKEPLTLTEANEPWHHDEDEPVIAFVDQLIIDAINKKISDIHIEPYADYCRIRFRCDGLLYEAATIPNHLSARLITRLKIMAKLNIAEKRLPQDGHIVFQQERKLDIRVNTCPVQFGEKMVLRILNTQQMDLNIHALGWHVEQEKIILEKILAPHGLILVTGPTGSGKTITLYSILSYLNQIEKNILTVEDPVEIEFSGINQTTINPRIGLDFATLLRAFLRQDPDILLIGEIRDQETAKIALQAAETGHLVLASLHTNNTIEALARLQSLGITEHHLFSAISLITAQRLVRVLCPICSANQTMICQYCHRGYQGRTGIFECLPLNEELVKFILTETTSNKINYLRSQMNWWTLWDAGKEKVARGITTHEELFRVLGKEDGFIT